MMICLKISGNLHISGLVGAVWSAPPCRFYSPLRKNDGGPPPLRSKDFLDGLPSLSPHQQRQVQESKEIHRRSDLMCIAVFQQGGFAGKEQPLNSLAWKEPSSQQFVEQCSCYFVATPACKWGLDISKHWALAATSDSISSLAGQCSHQNHMDFRGKRLPDGSYVSALTAEYPSALASAIINIISPWVSQSSLMNQDLSTWRTLLSKNPITRGPRITDGAGGNSSAIWTIPASKDFFKSLRQTWIKRILQNKLYTHQSHWCLQASPIRSLHHRGRHRSLPARYSRILPFHFTRLLYTWSPTIPTSAPPFIAPHFRGSRHKDCHLTSRRYTLRSLLTTPPSWTVGTQQQNFNRIPRSSCVQRQLDKCQPRSRSHKTVDPKRTWWRLYWRNTRHQNSWTEMAQRYRVREIGSGPCRQSGSKTGSWFHHLRYEWKMPFTRETTPP